jgi:hypothetical protein
VFHFIINLQLLSSVLSSSTVASICAPSWALNPSLCLPSFSSSSSIFRLLLSFSTSISRLRPATSSLSSAGGIYKSSSLPLSSSVGGNASSFSSTGREISANTSASFSSLFGCTSSPSPTSASSSSPFGCP